MNTLKVRNIIMYTVVSAVLLVAAFGIYNVISTVVMEKHRDIAILKSMGFDERDIERIFLLQGMIVGVVGMVRDDPIKHQMEHFGAVVRGEVPPLVSARDGLANLRVTEAIVEAARAGKTIEIKH